MKTVQRPSSPWTRKVSPSIERTGDLLLRHVRQSSGDGWEHRKSSPTIRYELPGSTPPQPPRERVTTASTAEQVILQIFKTLHCLDDLFATAVLNKAFYRIYKQHELSLMRTVLRNQSPASWELRELSVPHPEGSVPDSEMPEPEYTPLTYLEYHKRDFQVIEALKSLILTRCQSFLRSDTVAALSSTDAKMAKPVDDALYRIWSFCLLFGSNKNREDDLVGQLDWLRGGAVAHRRSCTSTIVSVMNDFDVADTNGVLFNPPDCFGAGNHPGDGLSAEELYAMTELWNCLSVLLQGFQGCTDQAREYGVFDPTCIGGGDVDGEEAMLEEWHYYLLTLGPARILDLANAFSPTRGSVVSGFALAKTKNLTQWTPPSPTSSRATFLKEAVAKAYEQKVALRFCAAPAKLEMQEVKRKRVASLAEQLRLRRSSSEYKRLPLISAERPMSEWSTVGGGSPLAPSEPGTDATRASSILSSISSASARCGNSAAPLYHHSNNNIDVANTRNSILQTIGERADAINKDALGGFADATSDRAVTRIMEMGFGRAEAREALRITDMGDGLRVDRAVEMLLRAQVW
ncbi:hypothetical protein LTR16_001183 [Cryomyces antarcticus]|uniref:UBA domain-containing protein n=1 Tax=Cryomyces antarcticus TaxID=329879 RepID=A0ABR0M8A4_9PEZI|nr:hypothetical protein LTR16_001183 [Cryomyces antarcticus]